MIFIETSVFSRQALDMLTDAELRELQQALADRPEAGDLLVAGRGLRKLRWRTSGGGKSGGLRLIYYWATGDDQILMLFLYRKSEQGDLTQAQLKVLRQIAEQEYP